jgi:hypothetical protein
VKPWDGPRGRDGPVYTLWDGGPTPVYFVGWRDDPRLPCGMEGRPPSTLWDGGTTPVYLVGWRDDPRLPCGMEGRPPSLPLVGNLDCYISGLEKDYKHAFVYLAAYYSDNHMNNMKVLSPFKIFVTNMLGENKERNKRGSSPVQFFEAILSVSQETKETTRSKSETGRQK